MHKFKDSHQRVFAACGKETLQYTYNMKDGDCIFCRTVAAQLSKRLINSSHFLQVKGKLYDVYELH